MSKQDTQITAEEFLIEKLEDEIATIGNGMSEFHTKDLEFLLNCLHDKHNKERQTKDLLEDAVKTIKWLMKHTGVIDFTLRNDAFNIPTNTINSIKDFLNNKNGTT